ncbi:MAG TPA: bifunctional rhamnulose-1-phosphate aldolase/short-chain dehydrogenase [Bryobacteraceae bacterium]|nr:bifunctional rhamnulose-1-phosphate aldolase/short-chain dehydrogenase [Bryobacteraceae bacterium]
MPELKYLKDLWDSAQEKQLENDPLELLRYRSNLLGADLRITNFGGGNTSSKMTLTDPFSQKPTRVLAVKGSGGDLGSIKKTGFALLYLERLEQLRSIYRGETHEDEMVDFYPLGAFGNNRVAASIDTPLHAFLPFDHVDHLHPDWAIAVAASANGDGKLQEFNSRFGRKLVWLPWQRPGFELALMLREAVERTPGCDGIVLGGHGLFTWGNTQRECYLNSIHVIDEFGQFVAEHAGKKGKAFGGPKTTSVADRAAVAAAILPTLRGLVGSMRRSIGHFNDSEDVLEFVNSKYGEELSALGTSCPDHFLRTRVRPLFIAWNHNKQSADDLKAALKDGIEKYRIEYGKYYESFATPESPKIRDNNPSVVLISGLGMFSFGKNKPEARITGEFFVNAIHVMSGATALGDEKQKSLRLPQPRRPEDAAGFRSLHNYVSLPPGEAFRIEYWALEEAKLQRMPPEKEFSRRIFLVAGGGSGIGRAVALHLAKGGAHVVVADRDAEAAHAVEQEIAKIAGKEAAHSCAVDITSSESVAAAFRETLLTFGGLDGVINTAALFPVPQNGSRLSEAQWRETLDVNVTGNHLLAEEAGRIFTEQGLPSVIVLTSSANAIVPKYGSEVYDISKTAVNHLVRSLAIGLAPHVRVNAIAPATVIAGSSMFPRDRVIVSLKKYKIAFDESESTDELRSKLAQFYANRTLTRRPITPDDCAEAIAWLASDRSGRTSGHIIPVDGGLPEAFLR